MYHIIMKPEKVSCGILINMGPGMVCYEPLGAENYLASSSFPLSVSFIFGDVDWMAKLEEDGPKKVVEINSK